MFDEIVMNIRFVLGLQVTFVIFFSIIYGSNVSAQVFPKEKRIYLVDVTASMTGKGIVKTPDIFNKVKDELKNAVMSINDVNTEIVIIPFTNVPHSSIRGLISNRDSLISAIDKLSVRPGDTNIADAWSHGIQEIDSTRVNFIFMLTDGLHNYGPEKEALYDRLESWSSFARGHYYFAFYVMLTPNAKEQKICDIVDKTEQMWLIESSDVNISFISTYLNAKANIYDNKERSLPFRFSNPDAPRDNLKVDLKLEPNPYYEISYVGSNMDRGFVNFKIKGLKPLMELPIKTTLRLHILYDKEKNYLTFFTPEVVNLTILNHGTRIMIIKPIGK